MKGLQKISLPSQKTALIGASLFAIIVIGTGSILISQSQINAQKTQIALLQQTIKKNNDQINNLVKNNASQSAQIQELLTKPTPTPIIETHYVSQASQAVNPTPTLTQDQAAAAVALKLMEESAQHSTTVIQSPQRTSTTCTYTMTGMICN